ncbi:hypothetical protein V8E55_004519 [Tylopilus felleus]
MGKINTCGMHVFLFLSPLALLARLGNRIQCRHLSSYPHSAIGSCAQPMTLTCLTLRRHARPPHHAFPGSFSLHPPCIRSARLFWVSPNFNEAPKEQ